MYRLDFGAVLTNFPLLLWGCLGTLELAIAGMTVALIIGIAGVVLRQSQILPVRAAVIGFVELIRNTPFLVQLYFIFFALPYLGLRLTPTVSAIVALGTNGGAYAVEIIRGGLQSIEKGQIDAGRALGLHRADVFRHIVLKPAVRAIYPALTSQFIMLTLTSSVCSAISAYELTDVGQRIESATFRSFEVYFTITGMYLVMSWLLMLMFASAARRLFAYPTR